MATQRENSVAVFTASEPAPSTAHLVGGIISDVQALVHQEIALVRQETIEAVGRLKTAGVALAAAGAVLAAGSLLLLMSLAQGVSALLQWPDWAGFLCVGAVLAITGALLVSMAQKRFEQFLSIPKNAVEIVKEDIQWLKEAKNGTS